MRFRLWAIARVIPVACLFASIAWIHGTPVAEAFEWPIHEFNTENNGAAAQVVIFSIAAAPNRPWFVGLSEVCNFDGINSTNPEDMADYIEGNLFNLGYSTSVSNYFAMRGSSSACLDANMNPQAIGAMAYTRGPGLPSRSFYFDHQVPSSGYLYGAICAESSTYLGHIVACATHLYSGSGVPAQNQAEDLRAYASLVYPGVKKVLLGDFNMRPPPATGYTPVPAGYYVNYLEVDQTYNNETRDSHIKNDFIFGAKNAFYTYGNQLITNVAQSDHHYFVGSFFS